MQSFYGVNWEINVEPRRVKWQGRESMHFRAYDGRLEYWCYCSVKSQFEFLETLCTCDRVIVEARVIPSTPEHRDFLDVMSVTKIGNISERAIPPIKSINKFFT